MKIKSVNLLDPSGFKFSVIFTVVAHFHVNSIPLPAKTCVSLTVEIQNAAVLYFRIINTEFSEINALDFGLFKSYITYSGTSVHKKIPYRI